jgi:hypothetical protein
VLTNAGGDFREKVLCDDQLLEGVTVADARIQHGQTVLVALQNRQPEICYKISSNTSLFQVSSGGGV